MRKPDKQKKKDIVNLIKEHILSQRAGLKRRSESVKGLTLLAYVITSVDGEKGARLIRERVDLAITEALIDRKVRE